MNSFEYKFFAKYIPEWQVIKSIAHEHWVRIIWKLSFNMIWLVLIPCFIYFLSERIHSIIPFTVIEVYLILLYFKIIYDLFDWYNDVWIITNKWVIDLDWALFKTDMKTVNYENIEWVEVEQSWIIDKILNKWDLVIHKIWDDTFILKDCISPYLAVNQIEIISNEKEDNKNSENEKFDLVMDTLAWVVQDYLWDKWLSDKDITKQKFKEELFEKIEEKNGTIDLR